MGGLLCVVVSATVSATILDVIFENLSLTSAETVQGKAIWGSPSDRPLDITAEGLGCEAVGVDNSYVEAWLQTEPIALGSYRQPWSRAWLTIDIAGFVDQSGFSCVSGVFVRHSPDRKHWSSWQAMRQKSPEVLEAEMIDSEKRFPPRSDRARETASNSADAMAAYKKRVIFVCDLAVPRTTREAYQSLLAGFAATNPPRPKFQEDAVRWILARDPHYLETDPPFIGYVEFLVEADLGKSPRRLKGLFISADNIVDELMGHLTDANRSEYAGKKWSFVAP